jgi:uncharacterized protein
MFIDIHELELHPVDFAEEFGPGVLDLGLDSSQRTPLKTTGRAELVPELHGKHERLLDIRVHGDFSTSLEVPCARCLEPVITTVGNSYDLLYRPEGSDSGKEELSVTAAEAEISYYPGNGLELKDVLQEQVLLAVPLKILCRPDCKGLCPSCGRNRNLEPCNCAEKNEDPRWGGLQDIRKQLKT